MHMYRKRITSLLLAAVLLLSLVGCGMLQNADDILTAADGVYEALNDPVAYSQNESETMQTPRLPTTPSADIGENGVYTEKDDVALYIHLYGHLPDNFVTKSQAREKGWEGGSVEGYFPGCSIGGDRFGNREGLLPKANGRVYTECDIDTLGASGRGAKRIVFSNDGLIYYTEDHYSSFTLLYGEE